MNANTVLARLVLLCLLVLVSTPAFAYLDPSTGSMVISAIVGVFATLVIAAKTYWYRLKRFFGGGRGKNSPGEEGDGRGDAARE